MVVPQPKISFFRILRTIYVLLIIVFATSGDVGITYMYSHLTICVISLKYTQVWSNPRDEVAPTLMPRTTNSMCVCVCARALAMRWFSILRSFPWS